MSRKLSKSGANIKSELFIRSIIIHDYFVAFGEVQGNLHFSLVKYEPKEETH